MCFFFHSYPAPRNLPSFPTRRSSDLDASGQHDRVGRAVEAASPAEQVGDPQRVRDDGESRHVEQALGQFERDRKSTRLNSSHPSISYAVFCLKKKKKKGKLYGDHERY